MLPAILSLKKFYNLGASCIDFKALYKCIRIVIARISHIDQKHSQGLKILAVIIVYS